MDVEDREEDRDAGVLIAPPEGDDLPVGGRNDGERIRGDLALRVPEEHCAGNREQREHRARRVMPGDQQERRRRRGHADEGIALAGHGKFHDCCRIEALAAPAG